MTIGNATWPIVFGTIAIAQMTRIAATVQSSRDEPQGERDRSVDRVGDEARAAVRRDDVAATLQPAPHRQREQRAGDCREGRDEPDRDARGAEADEQDRQERGRGVDDPDRHGVVAVERAVGRLDGLREAGRPVPGSRMRGRAPVMSRRRPSP